MPPTCGRLRSNFRAISSFERNVVRVGRNPCLTSRRYCSGSIACPLIFGGSCPRAPGANEKATREALATREGIQRVSSECLAIVMFLGCAAYRDQRNHKPVQ